MAFAVGDLAILVKHYRCPQYEGEIVTVSDGLALRYVTVPDRPLSEVLAYVVECPDGTRLAAEEYQLKKLPPEHTAAKWSSLRGIWCPDRENALRYQQPDHQNISVYGLDGKRRRTYRVAI